MFFYKKIFICTCVQKFIYWFYNVLDEKIPIHLTEFSSVIKKTNSYEIRWFGVVNKKIKFSSRNGVFIDEGICTV